MIPNKEIVFQLRKKHLLVFDEPNQVRLEIVKGCNLNCSFCGVTKDTIQFMTIETLNNILNGLTNKVKRIEFALHGEPSLHPKLNLFVEKVKKVFPHVQLYMITNGEIYKKIGFENILSIFKSGINFLQIDLYNETSYNWFQENLIKFSKKLTTENIVISNYEIENSLPHSYKSGTVKVLLWGDRRMAFNAPKNITKNPHNWGGNLPLKQWSKLFLDKLKDFPIVKRCAEPYKYMTILYNGDVLICCHDGAKTTILGNCNEQSTIEIWQGEKFQQLRLLLRNGLRKNLLPCFLCNTKSLRVGLYPYWGKEYFYEECLDTISEISVINIKEPLYFNLIEYHEKIKLLPKHILNILRR